MMIVSGKYIDDGDAFTVAGIRMALRSMRWTELEAVADALEKERGIYTRRRLTAGHLAEFARLKPIQPPPTPPSDEAKP